MKQIHIVRDTLATQDSYVQLYGVLEKPMKVAVIESSCKISYSKKP